MKEKLIDTNDKEKIKKIDKSKRQDSESESDKRRPIGIS